MLPFDSKSLLICCLGCLCVIASQAQQLETYKGTYALNQYKGEASFQYMMIDGDTLLSGPFTFEEKNPVSDSTSNRTKFLVNGQYEEGLAKGSWEISYADLEIGTRGLLQNYKLVTNLNGSEDRIRGQFHAGKPEGEWSFVRVHIRESEAQDTSFSSKINYKMGVPQLGATLRLEGSSLVARFLRNGLAHDEWTLFEEDAIEAGETWNFSEGLLLNISTQIGSNVKTFEIYDLSADQALVSLPLDERYLRILAFENPEAFEISTRTGDILLKNLEVVNRAESAFLAGSENIDLHNYKVRVPYYEIKSNQRTSINKVYAKCNRSSQIASGILTNSQLNISRLSDFKIARLFDETKSIENQYLRPLRKLQQLDQEEILSYVGMQKILANLFPRGLSWQEIDIKSNGKLSLENIEYLANSTYLRLEEISEELSTIAPKVEREEAIVSEEEVLVEKAQNFQEKLAAVLQNSDQRAHPPHLAMASYAEKRLAEYADLEDSEDKLARARRLELCYDKLSQLSDTILVQPARIEDLKLAYTDQVWNPFTSTLMDETVKKKLLKTYEEVLIPYGLDVISEGLTCDNVGDFTLYFHQLYSQLIILRDKKTGKIERKLKRKKNPEEILSLLGL